MCPYTPETHPPYQSLTPDRILGAVESLGWRCDGRLLALNSYENRVYQIGVEDAAPLVAKFYRPQRWSDEAILEEHAFSLELAEREIPVVAPLPDPNGRTLHHYQGFRFAVYPRRGGRYPELDDPERRLWLGRFIGRIHAVGAIRPFTYRPQLRIEHMGEDAYRFLLDQGFIPRELRLTYRALVEDLLTQVRDCFGRAGEPRYIRLHGDCHAGNILWTGDGPHFVDLDDCIMSPALQDLWMLLSGDRAAMTVQLADLLEGYTDFHDFNPLELHLVEALRTLRMIHYSAWLARRWHDPAFPRAFPWFNTPVYWEEQVQALREQAYLLEQPPLAVAQYR
jgi:Ser/Thr protein kinase RdoA (MazF antagonist)